MGHVGIFVLLAIVGVVAGCEEPEPRQEYIEVASEHRECLDGEACGVVETSCVSMGCECGVAVNADHLIDYQQRLAECRGKGSVATCDFACQTPFAKCFEGACVLTDEPQELIRHGRNIRELCESTAGKYVGCPECPPNERCKSCEPCECRSTDRWTKRGCRKVVRTEARDILVEVRPSKVPMSRPIKARITNDSRRTIWLKTMCGTPFYQARKKQEAWENTYQLVPNGRCKPGAIEIRPGGRRPFVVKTLGKLADASGHAAQPGTYRFELVYTDVDEEFRRYDTVYSAEFDGLPNRSRR